MGIGETLTEAREHAGLTVADVSARTRIREGLIRAIEHDDFDACGGDFYARGHIRAIAATVSADSGALIREYDAAHPAGRPVTLEELPERSQARRESARSVLSRRELARMIPVRREPGRSVLPRPHLGGPLPTRPVLVIAVVLVLAAIGLGIYALTSGGSGGQRLASESSSGHRTAHGGATRPAGSNPTAGTTPAAHATPTTGPSSGQPPAAPAQVSDVIPASAAAFGPGGASDGDNPQDAAQALSGDPATPWRTNWYTTPRFGNLQAGTGLLLDLGRTRTVSGVSIRLGDVSGADFQLRTATTTTDFTTVARRSDAGGLVRLRLSSPVRARYLLIWFTLLPPDNAGTYQAAVSAVTATVPSGGSRLGHLPRVRVRLAPEISRHTPQGMYTNPG